MTRTFRLATADDAEELLALTLRAYAPIRELGIHFAAATADLALVQKNIHNHACYVLEEDGQIQATVSLRMPWGPQPGPFGLPHIWWFAVDPAISKKGIGSALLTWVEEVIVRDTLKAPAVSLGTAEEHPWLSAIYERRGYVRAGEANLGRGHKTIYFRKELQTPLP